MSESPRARLDALARRIEAAALDPDEIESKGLFRLATPLYRLAGYRARVQCVALGALSAALRSEEAKPDEERAAWWRAVEELAESVESVERAAILRKRPSVAHAAWLRRAWELLVLSDRAMEARSDEGDDAARRCAGAVDESALFLPLTLAQPKPDKAPPADGMSGVVETRDELPESVVDARVVELELAAIDHLLAAARAERRVFSRRRRLLVAARQRLLEASAALPLDSGGARARADYVTREIARIDRLEAAGVSMDVGLVEQARRAVARGDPRTLHAALVAIDGAALAAGDADRARAAGAALGRLWEGQDRAGHARASLQRSAVELLGSDVFAEVAAGVAAGREALGAQQLYPYQKAALDKQFAGAEEELLASALATDGCFEVGGALSPVRVEEEERFAVEVRYPTQDLSLAPAEDIRDVPTAIVTDPRSVLLDLAAGRLLTRRFAELRTRARAVTRLQSEVRVYVLDGSTSMHGPRARVRDALLVAEIATLLERIRSPGHTRTTLHFRFFDEELGPVTRVDGVASAKSAIREVVGTVREGGTDIQQAILASLQQVAVARELDPDLSRAQIVLVTDGESEVDEAAIVRARAALGGVPIGLSVIALGEENAALRGIVARQRARGERAFYHFLDDAQLGRIARGEIHAGPPLHLPEGRERAPARVARELEREVGALVEELEAIDRASDVSLLERLDAETQARREMLDGLEPSGDDGERARLEAMNRDRLALGVRYARWFPEPRLHAAVEAEVGLGPEAPTREREDVEATVAALASIAEVVALLGGSELGRRADAIELLERLLPDARLTPARYRAVLSNWPGAVAAPLRAVHEAVRGPT